MLCYCCEPDEHGDYNPCCYYTGYCEAHYLDEGIGNCIHCGGEMFQEDGNWYHHSQKAFTIDKRYTTHWQMSKPLNKKK